MRCLFLVLLAACSAPPPPLMAPAPRWQADTLPSATAATEGERVRIELHATGLPAPGTPLEDEVVAILGADGRPFVGAAPLAGARTIEATAAEAWPVAAERAGIASVFAGASPEFTCPRGVATTVTTGVDRMPQLELVAHEDRLECRLVFAPPPPTAAPGQFDAPNTPAPLRVVLRDTSDIARGWFVPTRDDRAGYVLCLRRLGPAGEAAVTQAVEPAPPPPSLLQAQADLVRSSVGAAHRRGALLALANRAPHAALVDALLTADEATLIAISRDVGALATTDEATFAWRLWQTIWSQVLTREERAEAPPGMRACLLRHFGALGDDPGGLQQLLERCADHDAFWTGVQRENVLALADRHLPMRVRAHDWLALHGAAVADYDPFGELAQRERALRAARSREVGR